MTDVKAKVSLRAFEGRCKRYAEKHDGDTLKKCRVGTTGYSDLGDYYFVDTHSGAVTHRLWSQEALENWAREKGILKPYEVVVE